MSWIRNQVRRMPLPTNPGGLVYGTILSATLISAEYAKAERYGGALGGIALAEIIYWLALSYSEFAGERVRKSQNLEKAYLHGRFGALPDVDRTEMLRTLGLIG